MTRTHSLRNSTFRKLIGKRKQLIKLADNTRRPWTLHYCPGEKHIRSDGILRWNVKPVCNEVRKLPDLQVLMPFDDRLAMLNDSTRIPVPTHKKVAHQHDPLLVVYAHCIAG